MKIIAISGLGADERVFEFLKLNVPIEVVMWIKFNKTDSLESYALRLSKQIYSNEPFILLGVSFGGMLAIELQKYINPKATILISSAATKYDIPYILRVAGKSAVYRCLPYHLLKMPKTLGRWLFGAKNLLLFNSIIDDTDLRFLKWALGAIANWKQVNNYGNIIRIHGTKDKLIPFKNNSTDIAINKGEHFMIVDNAEEISLHINKLIEQLTTKVK